MNIIWSRGTNEPEPVAFESARDKRARLVYEKWREVQLRRVDNWDIFGVIRRFIGGTQE